VNNLSKTLVLCSALVLTACAEDDPLKFIEEGKVLFEKGEMKSARVQFKNALQVDPKLAEAYYGLALLDEKKPDWPAMKKNLQDVVMLDPMHIEALIKLGFLSINDIDKAKKLASAALKLAPENINAILLSGRIQFREDNKIGALQHVDRVLVKDAGNAEATWLKATVFLADKKYDEALLSLNQGILVHPDNAGLGLLKAKVHKELGRYDEVIQDYDDLVARHPEDESLRYARIKLLSQFGKSEMAEEAIRDAITKAPEDVALKISLVNNVERDDPEQVEALLKKFIEENPAELRFKTRLAGFYTGHKRLKEAQEILNNIVAADPNGKDGLIAKVRLAEMLWEQGGKAGATQMVEDVLAIDIGNSGALLFRAGVSLDKKMADAAVSDLRIVLRDQPNSDKAMVMMASAHVLKGEAEVAESYLRKAIDINPANFSAIVPLTSALLARGDAMRAEELLVKSIKNSPNTPELIELLVKLRVSKKDWLGAESAINDLKQQSQGELPAQMLTAMMLDKKGLEQEALQTYKEVLVNNSGANDALSEVGRLYVVLDRRGEFVSFLEGFIKENTLNVAAYNMLGQEYAVIKQWDNASAKLNEALKLQPKSIGTYKLLAAVYAQQGKVKEITELYKKGLEVSPGNSNLMMGLARHYVASKKNDLAISTYKSLLDKFPENEMAVNNLADLLLNSSDNQDSLQQVVTLVERFKNSDNAYFLDTYGWVKLKSGQAEEAVEVLHKVVQLAPKVAVFRYHLGEAYFAVKNNAASKVELEKSLLLAKKNNEFLDERAGQLLKEVELLLRS